MVATTTVTIAPLAAPFSYACPPFCRNGPNAAPVLTAATGGTFAAAGGLVLNPSTGVVDLPASPKGRYTVRYTTPQGCVSTASLEIIGKLVFPNVITPNADGKNDVLRPNLANVTDYYLQVFSRWGRRVYDGRDLAQGWTAAGSSAGMCYYQLEYVACTGTRQNSKTRGEVIK